MSDEKTMTESQKPRTRRGGRRRTRRGGGGAEGRPADETRSETPRSEARGESPGEGRGEGRGDAKGRPRTGSRRRRRSRDEGASENGRAEARGGENRRRRRSGGGGGRGERQEGIRDATANRMARAGDRSGNRGQRRGGGGQHRGGGHGRKGLEILKLLQQQVSIDPYERFNLETGPNDISMRVMELITPIGRGQRALIVSPPKAGKTTLLTQFCNAVTTNHPDVKVFALLVDERPEEVTHFRRSTEAEVFAASSDMSTREHIQTAEECMNAVVEPVLAGEDVVLVLDSITRLARAYNSVQGNSGRTLSGGLDANTMLAPRQIFGAARKIEDGGSLTILGTALVDTGSRMDEVIFQEFKGTGNTELVLSRDLFEKRIFPCVDIGKSGTRKEEKLYPPEMVGHLYALRRMAASYPPDKAMLGILKLMQRYKTNEELLQGLASLE